MQTQDKTIVEIAAGNPDFETLVTAVKAADLVETLNGAGNFTVFAPTDAAFDALPAGLLEALVMPKNKAVLQKILTYHVVGSKLGAKDVVAGIKGKGGMLAATTVEGSDFTAMLKDGNVMIKDGQGNMATVLTTDIMASNGVIHVIDRVILPAGVEPGALLGNKMMNQPKGMKTGMKDKAVPAAKKSGASIAQLATKTEDLSTLTAALKAADLVSVFNSNGEFTVFAPTNAAFDKLPAGTLDNLLKPENKATLQNILQYHVIFAPLSAETLINKVKEKKGYYSLNTFSGETLIGRLVDGKVKIFDENGNSATVIKTDINANNGVIHLIDEVLLPRSK